MKTLQWITRIASILVSVAAQHSGTAGPLDLWAARNSGTTGPLLGVAYGHGTFVAVGGLPPFNPGDPIRPSLLVSSNAINWNPLTLPTNANFYGVSYVNEEFIAVGNSGLILRSPDGLSWALQQSWAPNRTTDIYPLGGVAFGNGMFVAVDRLLGNTCLASTNGVNWTSVTLQPGGTFLEICRVHFVNGMFIACGVGNSAVLLTSTNGLNWTEHPVSSMTGIINDTAYGAGRWVGVGDLAAIITSVDGLRWTQVKAPAAIAQANINLHGITYADGLFVAVGDSGTLLISGDGLNWNVHTSLAGAAFNAIAFGNGSLVAVGLNGSIWQSGPLLYLEAAKTTQGTSLVLSSPSGLRASVQSSMDLMNWTELFTIGATESTQTLLDTNSVAGPPRFYRAVAGL